MMNEEEKEEDRLNKREYMTQYCIAQIEEERRKIRIGSRSNTIANSSELIGLSPKSTMKRETGFRTKLQGHLDVKSY